MFLLYQHFTFLGFFDKVYLQLFHKIGGIFLNLEVSKNIFAFLSYVKDNLGGYRLCKSNISQANVDVILFSF